MKDSKISELFSFAISGCKFSRLLESTWGKTHSIGEVLGILLALNVHLDEVSGGKLTKKQGDRLSKFHYRLRLKTWSLPR